jgi:hypothetical protein
VKKQKPPAENFSFEVSGMARTVGPEKFVRPDLRRTGIWCCGLAGWKCTFRIIHLFLSYYKTTSMVEVSIFQVHWRFNDSAESPLPARLAIVMP